MELPSQEEEMTIPLNTTYGGGHGHMIHRDPSISTNHITQVLPPNGPHIVEDHMPFKKMVKYKECLKNHAASMGGNATDGCGEFMPSGEEGTLEALTCSACNCHRNFHRKEVEGELSSCDHNVNNPRTGRKVFLGHNLGPTYHHGTLIPSRAVAPNYQIMSYNYMGASLGSDQSDEVQEGYGGGSGGGGMVARQPQVVKKRFRTKFTQEQKEKMFKFAEKVGWKLQKQEEAVVQQFCQEVGIKRRVLKVWMHNNKHNLAKKTHVNPQDQVQRPSLTTKED